MPEETERVLEYLLRLLMALVVFFLGVFFVLDGMTKNSYELILGTEFIFGGYLILKNQFKGFGGEKNNPTNSP